MQNGYVKNPLDSSQIMFIHKLNKLTLEMAEHYGIAAHLIDGKFFFEPACSILVLDIVKMGYTKDYNRGNYNNIDFYLKEEVDFIKDMYPLFMPFHVLSICLIEGISPLNNSMFILVEKIVKNFFTEDTLAAINKNIRKIRKENLE